MGPGWGARWGRRCVGGRSKPWKGPDSTLVGGLNYERAVTHQVQHGMTAAAVQVKAKKEVVSRIRACAKLRTGSPANGHRALQRTIGMHGINPILLPAFAGESQRTCQVRPGEEWHPLVQSSLLPQLLVEAYNV